MQFISATLCSLLVAFLPSLSVARDILDDLSVEQQAAVKGGEQVLITEKIEGNPWPKVKVYRTIDAKPEEVTAIFFDYKNAKSFIPNLLKSEISQKHSACDFDIDYGIDVPILPDEYYTVRNKLTVEPDGCYLVKWKLVKAIMTKDSEGSLRMEPYQDKTVILYQNLVTPGSSMAGILRGRAISQMEDTVEAIAAHVEKLKKNNPAQVADGVKSLRAALGSEKAN